MPGVEQPKTRTLASPQQMRDALRGTWLELFNAVPSKPTLSVLLAHWALETARSLERVAPRGKACWCWNLGNQKYPAPPVRLGERGDWFWNRCNEIVNGKVVWFDKPNRAACFQAFATLHDGCLGYLGLLKRRYTACGAWAALERGDPRAYSKALKRGGYYTASEPQYTSAVVRLCSEFARLPDVELPPTVRLGSQGEAVAKWLAVLGVPTEFGALTEAATKRWQKAHGLLADGVVGTKTWTKALYG